MVPTQRRKDADAIVRDGDLRELAIVSPRPLGTCHATGRPAVLDDVAKELDERHPQRVASLRVFDEAISEQRLCSRLLWAGAQGKRGDLEDCVVAPDTLEQLVGNA